MMDSSQFNHGDSTSKDVVHDEHRLESAHETAERGHAATDKLGRPVIEFDKAAEAKLRLKIDLYIVPTAFLLYLFCFIDRTNIGNARLVGFEKDLGLTGYDYNAVLSYFYISYILFEIPANMLCKMMGPGWFLPLCTIGFGISSLAYAWVRDIHSAAGVRFLLGAFEAGLLPGLAYYLSRWYRRDELVFRLSLYIVAAPLAGAFGGLMASGILKLPSFGSLHTWRMIFAIEGIITIGIGLLALLTMTDRPSSARWLSEEEKDLAISRLKSERIGVTEVLDKIDKSKILRGMFCPVTLATSWIFLLINITVQGLSIFAPTIIRTIYPTHTVISQQLHTVPLYISGAVLTVAISFASWKYNRRTVFMLISGPLIVIGYIMFLATNNARVRFGATFLIAGGAFPFGALCNAHVSANVVSDTARSSAIATNVMMGNLGGLISTWSFLPRDAPNFPIGNGLNLASSALVVITAAALLVWMKFDNRKRENIDASARLEGFSQKQIQDMDWRHPVFRWKL